jgi:hypothetical protein
MSRFFQRIGRPSAVALPLMTAVVQAAQELAMAWAAISTAHDKRLVFDRSMGNSLRGNDLNQ